MLPRSRRRIHERRVSALLTFHSGVGFEIAVDPMRGSRGKPTRNLEAWNMYLKVYGFALMLAILPVTAFAQSAPT